MVIRVHFGAEEEADKIPSGDGEVRGGFVITIREDVLAVLRIPGDDARDFRQAL
jgi:hypothetical protein